MSGDVTDARGGAGREHAGPTGSMISYAGAERQGGEAPTGEVEPAVAVAPNRGASQDRIFGLVAGLMILTAVVLLVKSLIGPTQVAESPPEVELVTPGDGDTVSLPVEIRLRPAEALSAQPGGWGASNFHLHAEVAGLELMPGPNEIRPASGSEYVWTIAALPSGETTLRLFWADAAHRPVVGGASGAVRILIR